MNRYVVMNRWLSPKNNYSVFCFYCFVYPLIISLYLSIPRMVSIVIKSDPSLDLLSSYSTLTFHYSQIYVCLYLLLQVINQRIALIAMVVLLGCDFFIRVLELVVRSVFGHGFNGIFFSHFSWDSIQLSLMIYWWLFLILIVFLSISVFLIRPILSPRFLQRTPKIVLLVVIILLAIRAVWFLNKELWHGEKEIALYSFIKQGSDYLKTNEYESKIQWTEEEVRFRSEIGMDPEISDFQTKQERTNVILIYFEGLGTLFSSLFDSKYPGLIPNTDRFAQRHSYFENFYNSATPTISALVSMSCGYSIQLNNHQLKNTMLASNKPCYPDLLHQVGYFQTFLVGSQVSFGGRKDFYLFHKFDEALGLDYLLEQHPEWSGTKKSWGLDDKHLFQAALEKLEVLRRKPPYHLVLLTLNSHHPYYVSEECRTYQSGDKLTNSTHCTDMWLGVFLNELEKRKFLDEAAILIVGDHQPHGHAPYGKVVFAVHHPHQKLEKIITTPGHSPDFAATILDLSAFDRINLGLGKSLLGDRQRFSRLIADFYEYNNGNFKLDNSICPPEKAVLSAINTKNRWLDSCERKKLLINTDIWLKEKGVAINN